MQSSSLRHFLLAFAYKAWCYFAVSLHYSCLGQFRAVVIHVLRKQLHLDTDFFMSPVPFVSHEGSLLSRRFWHPCRGTRFGEADHPGPVEFNSAITNPTAILQKQQHYGELISQYNLQAFVAAETSATLVAQKIMTSHFRKLGMQTTWSAPVLDQFQTVSGLPSLRGRAAGVACCSSFPTRVALDTITTTWQSTCRLLHSIVRVGHMDIQIVVIYGLASGQQAAQVNSDLTVQAIQAVNCLSLPALILGDFNANPFQLACAPLLQQQGYQDLQALHRVMYGSVYP